MKGGKGGSGLPREDRRVDRGAVCARAGLELLGRVAGGTLPLRAIGEELDALARSLMADRVIVAVDDPQLGRQVFCSARRPLGDERTGLWGPEVVVTEPPLELVSADAGILIGAVRCALGVAMRAEQIRRKATKEAFETALDVAVARARRSGWCCMLVLFDPVDRLAGEPDSRLDALRREVRAGEHVALVDGTTFGVLLDNTPSDRVPAVLARLTRVTDLGRLVFGVAGSPGEAASVDELMVLARERLEDARTRAFGIHRSSDPQE